MQSEQYNHSGDGISLRQFLFGLRNLLVYLRTKWLLLILAGLLGGCIGFFYAYKQKPVYLALLNFALEDDKSSGGGGIGGAIGLASSLGFDLGSGAGGAFSGANLVELMKSRRLIEKTLLNTIDYKGQQITLAELFCQMNGWREAWQKTPAIDKQLVFAPGADRTKFSLQQDSVLGMMVQKLNKDNLDVSQRDKKISIITVEVKTINELFSKYFAEILAREVSDFYVDTKSKKSKLNVQILERQTDSVRREVNGAITGVAVANNSTFNLNPALNVQRTSSSQRAVDVQANTAILTQLVINLEMARVTLRKETPLIQVIDTPILPLEKQRKSKVMTAIQFAFVFGFVVALFIIIRKYSRDFFKNEPKTNI